MGKKVDPRKYYAREMFRSAKRRSVKKGLPMDVDRDWIYQRLDRCEVTGIPFKLDGTGKGPGPHNNAFAPTLDRYDNTKGYTKTNTRVVVNVLNQMKMNFTPQDLIIFIDAMARVYDV